MLLEEVVGALQRVLVDPPVILGEHALADGLARVRDTLGPDALAGFGSAKGSNEEAYLFQKLVRTGFGTNNVDHCTRLCHAASVAALLEGIGSGSVTAPFMAAVMPLVPEASSGGIGASEGAARSTI